MLLLVPRLSSYPSSATDDCQTGFLETSSPPCVASTFHWKKSLARTTPFQDPGNSCCYGEGAEHVYLSSCYIFITRSLLRVLPNGDHGPLNTSRFPLPDLLPPRPGIIALLELPPSAKLHDPIYAHLTIRNHHPTRTANLTVQLEPDAADAFLVAGQRNARVPTLLPGAEVQLAWSLVPIECGFVRIPKIRVTDKRKAGSTSPTEQPPATEDEGAPVPVVSLRRSEKVVVEVVDGAAPEDSPVIVDTGGIGPILVLP
jgi:hypothetical protein